MDETDKRILKYLKEKGKGRNGKIAKDHTYQLNNCTSSSQLPGGTWCNYRICGERV